MGTTDPLEAVHVRRVDSFDERRELERRGVRYLEPSERRSLVGLSRSESIDEVEAEAEQVRRAREASLLCTFGELKLRFDAPTRWVPSDPEEPNLTVSMLPGKRAELQIGRWHSIQNVGGGAASWLYAMR